MNARAVHPLRELGGRWRTAAEELRRFGAELQAVAIERCVQELEDTMNAVDGAELTYAEAAEETGLSVDHIGRLVRAGQLTNTGRSHAPRIRRGELTQRCALPRRARTLLPGTSHATSRVQIARSVVHSAKEHDDG